MAVGVLCRKGCLHLFSGSLLALPSCLLGSAEVQDWLCWSTFIQSIDVAELSEIILPVVALFMLFSFLLSCTFKSVCVLRKVNCIASALLQRIVSIIGGKNERGVSSHFLNHLQSK